MKVRKIVDTKCGEALGQFDVGRRRTFLAEEFEDVERHAGDSGDG
jgi:hypothetical protein